MKKIKRNINTRLGLIDFMQIVMEIAAEYFVEKEYTPQFGMLNAMRIFYNKCYKLDSEPEIIEGLDMEHIVSDANFVMAFNDAISDSYNVDFTFGNAFAQAIDIVEYNKNKKTSIGEMIKEAIYEIEESIMNIVGDENIAILSSAFKDVDTSQIDANELVKNFVQSDGFKDIIQHIKDKKGE